VVYSGLVLLAAFSFQQGSRRLLRDHPVPPPISILKAVKGLDPGLTAALRSHCVQDYPAEVELLIGIHSDADPALPGLRAFQTEMQALAPSMRVEILLTPLVLGTNGKVSNLAQLLPHARFEHVLLSDADIAVSKRYLRRVVAPFQQANTGLVTAGYRGRTHPAERPTLGSRLEALAIATDFFPGVLVARLMDRGMRFGLGSTLLVSRRALAEAGGLEALTHVLADDHDLGERVARAGYSVILSPEPVSTSVPPYTLAEFWTHQLRWNRTVRALRPWSYFGLIVTHPIPWALLSMLGTGGSMLSIVFLLLAILARMAVAMRVGFGQLRDTQVLRDLVLLPLRDCFGLALWVWSYAGNTVEWRGEHFRIDHGRMVRIAKSGTGTTGIQ
jgi:ceramide glucosyltransferase